MEQSRMVLLVFLCVSPCVLIPDIILSNLLPINGGHCLKGKRESYGRVLKERKVSERGREHTGRMSC